MEPQEWFFIKEAPNACYRYILHADGSDSFEFLNEQCQTLWEVSSAQISEDASLIWKQLHPEDMELMVESVKRSAETLTPWELRFRVITPSGKTKFCHARGIPRRREDGSIIWTSFVDDITVQASMEEQNQNLLQSLKQSQKNIHLVDPSAAMGHELFNSVTINMLACEKMERQLQEAGLQDSEIYKTFESLKFRTTKMGSLIQSLKKLFNDGRSEPTVLSLGQCIENVIQDLGTREIVESSIDSALEIIADKEMLEVVFSNLIRNSLDAISDLDEKWIKISCSIRDGDLLICYTDSGKISKEAGARLFKYAFSEKKNSEGSGMGMLLVYKILENMHGSIQWDENSEHTKFMISLPF